MAGEGEARLLSVQKIGKKAMGKGSDAEDANLKFIFGQVRLRRRIVFDFFLLGGGYLAPPPQESPGSLASR